MVTVSGNGTYTTATGTNPGGYLPTATGTYLWTATYSGDTNNNGASDNGQNENETVTPARSGDQHGGRRHDHHRQRREADRHGRSLGRLRPRPARSRSRCTVRATSAVYTDVVTVSGNGTYTTATGTNPGGYLPTATGTYLWTATYSGDTNNNGATDNGQNENETVDPAGPAINTVAGGTIIIGSGTKLTDTAVLSGGYNPTGTITFTLYSPSNVGRLHRRGHGQRQRHLHHGHRATIRAATCRRRPALTCGRPPTAATPTTPAPPTTARTRTKRSARPARRSTRWPAARSSSAAARS